MFIFLLPMFKIFLIFLIIWLELILQFKVKFDFILPNCLFPKFIDLQPIRGASIIPLEEFQYNRI